MDEPASNQDSTKTDDIVAAARKQAAQGGRIIGGSDKLPSGPSELDARLPSWIADYQIHRLIAQGGGAWVFEASQRQPPRRVALKVLRDVISQEAMRRFVHEGRLLARLEHPNIVRIYEVGQWLERGVIRPFLVMEYVGPQTLTRYVREQGTDFRQRLRLLIEICHGIQHAHSRGIIHRDLKPSNIVVDRSGCPKVLDFGVAKAVRDETTMHTSAGQWLGTPPYMSPEQFTHDPDDIDVRCDVYALGAIGYELLSGQPPFRHEGRSTAQIIRDVCDEIPQPLGAIHADFSGDIETIFAKALQKRREDRYGSVAELSADIQAYLEHRPIAARRIGWGGVLLRWSRRQPATAASMGAAVLLGVVLLLLLVHEFASTRRVAERQRRELYANQVQAAARAFQLIDIETASRFLDEAQTTSEGDDLRDFVWFHLWKQMHGEERELRVHENAVFELAFSPTGHRMVSCGKDEWCLWDTDSWQLIHRHMRPGHTFTSVAFLPDGESFITASCYRKGEGRVRYFSNRLRRWDAGGGALLATSSPFLHQVNRVAVTADGSQAICGGGGLDERSRRQHAGELTVVSTDDLQGVSVPYSRRPLHGDDAKDANEFPTVADIAVTRDRRLLAIAQVNEPVKLLDAESGQLQPIAADVAPHAISVDFSPDENLLAIGNWNENVVLWDMHQQKVRATLPHPRAHTVRFSPDGTLLATTGVKNDTSIVLWRVEDQVAIDRLHGHRSSVWSLAFDPSGSHLLSGSADCTVRVWNLSGHHTAVQMVHGRGEVECLDLSSDGRWLAWGSRSGEAVLADLGTQEPLFRKRRDRSHVTGVSFHPRRPLLAIAFRELPPVNEETARIGVFHVPSGTQQHAVPHVRGQCLKATYSPDGNWLAATYVLHENQSLSDRIQVWDTNNWASWTCEVEGGYGLNAVAFSPDSRFVAGVGDDRRVRIWETVTGQLRSESPPFPAPLVSVAFSPRGDQLAVGNWPRDEFADHPTEIRVLDAETLHTERTLLGHRSGVCGLAFSPNGRILASGAGGGQVKLWDLQTGSELATLRVPAEGWVLAVKFSADGHSLFASYGSEDEDCGVIRYDAATQEEYRAHQLRSRSLPSRGG